MSRKKHIGILTAGGDCQGLNAALRGITLSALQEGWKVTGIHDGFVGLAEGFHSPIEFETVHNIANVGGTILGTGRGEGHSRSSKAAIDACVSRYHEMGLNVLICLGGDGTQRFSALLHEAGIPVVTLPKTIDNDIAETDITFGYNTAVHVSVMALDRLRTTAESHHRLMILEVMGRDAGWLAAGAALAGAADICLIPEIPYSMEALVSYINRNVYKRRSALLVIAEGAISKENHVLGLKPQKHVDAIKLVDQIPELTGMQARLTTLGYVSRGGTPTACDRIFATQCGTMAIQLIKENKFGVMVAQQKGELVAVPLERVAGNPRLLPIDHPMIKTMLATGVCIGV